MEKFGATDFLLPLSCKKHNFRKDLYPLYKDNRKLKPNFPPSGTCSTRSWRKPGGSKIVTIENLEGDDVLGLLASHPAPKRCPGKRIVVSIDKDLQTIPCRLYNPNKPDLGTRPISIHDANLFWMKQVITGDQVDNYPGFPGIGHKGADEILNPSTHEALLDADPREHLAALWEAVVRTYTTRIPRGGKEPLKYEDALTQARLARILRHGDYNPRKKEVKLWTP